MQRIALCTADQLQEYERRDLLRARRGEEGSAFSAEMLSRLLLLQRLVRLGVPLNQLQEALALSHFDRGGSAAHHAEHTVRPLLGELAKRIEEAVQREEDGQQLAALVAAQLQLAEACESLAECVGCQHSRDDCRVCGVVGQIDPIASALLVVD